jgi:hypothetical protein
MTTSRTKRAGHQFVGVGVGAIIFNAQGQVFLAKRGQEPRTSRDCGPGRGVRWSLGKR